mmetsp:Transcript_20010/g.60456  ORF Transcript_20010/g.60456 Transcript_20010/m.60456 type:complete len:208 (-) Transcript_20010:2063-2686(-)
MILYLTLRIGSSHSGPSRVPHWKPWTMESFTAFSRLLSTSDDSVSSTRMFAPWRSGPKAQMERAARRSHSYFSWKKAPTFLRGQSMLTAPPSISSARPLSSGSATMVSLLRLLGVSAKHFSWLVSTTVSAKLTTGSATLTSISLYSSRRSFMRESRYSSPVPRMACSPDSSTLVTARGYDLLMHRRPSTILGNSRGFRGSTATFTTL